MKTKKAIKYNKWYSFKEKIPEQNMLFIAITEPDKDGFRYIYEAWFNEFGQLLSSKEVANGDWLCPQCFTHWCYINKPPSIEA